MRSLPELQRAFGRALLQPADGAAEFGGGMRVYAGNVSANLRKALAGAYPVARKIVGSGFFDGLARAYAIAHPSDSGDLNRYGAHFAAFVDAHAETEDVPYLADVARMEWAVHRAHFAADARPFDPARYVGMAPELYGRQRLALAPGASLMVSRWPLGRLWAVHQEDYRGPPAVDFTAGFDRVLVYRARWRADVASVGPGDYRLLAEAGRGAALADALGNTASAVADFDAGAALARWVAAGVIQL